MRFQTKLLATAVAWGVATAAPDATGLDTEASSDAAARTPGCSRSDFWRYASALSKQAEVYFPDSALFTQYNERWSNLDLPAVNITILPATEKDVVEIVKIARTCKIPFLAYNGKHGAITTLGRMDQGIAINLHKLSSVVIATAGDKVTIGGGTNSKVVIDALWDAGKQTVTGTCECVSYLGPGLGGGHGWLQGHHGLIADQFLEMNVVLADGTPKTINANSDLWWAMKGAGHNFGIVTSITARIYPIAEANWAIETLIFTGDKVKALYQAANDHLHNNQPVGLVEWSYWMNIPDISPNPVIELFIIQEGVSAVDPTYTAPFHALGPISITPKSGTYRDIAEWVGISLAGPACQKTGAANSRFPIYLPAYNPTAQEEAYAAFAAATTAAGSPFANSLFMFEGYSTQGVAAVDHSSTAFAYRDDHLLLAPLITYTPAGPARDQEAAQLGNQLREILHSGSGRSEMHTYVNYAYGDEPPKEWYGPEQWRQDRLKALKAKYDPTGKFSFYAPAV
ncbi:hypothetical protein C8A00DRAFT_35466 [Chaetomidium leptoderma]|uniref:FAD-binding PCMH-type domain-containing protein n=1 Tax=Chaetomidium leptoderma TaxID=669021 RepID=A0AAN6ZWZ8_9PEZI|nr:hypothetical protein C8A00DRAFT_35466 [Chaetomidium leptoderma]